MSLLASWAFGIAVSATTTCTAGPPAQANCTFAANPNLATADGSTAITVNFVARDAFNNLAPNMAVSLSASGTGNSFAAASGSTDANGIYTTTLRSSVAQSKTRTAVFNGNMTVTTSVTFAPGAASAATSSFAVNPNNTVANNNNTLTAVLTLLDV